MKKQRKYFSALINKRYELGIDSLIDFIIIEKDLCERNESNPKRIIDLILIKLEEINKKQVSNISLINNLLRVLSDNNVECHRNLCKHYRKIFTNKTIRYFNIEDDKEIKNYLNNLLDNKEEYNTLIIDKTSNIVAILNV